MSPFVNGAEFVCDETVLRLVADRSMAIGHASLTSVDILLHRRTSHDDWRGVGEPLDDNSVVNPTIWLSLDPQSPLLLDVHLLLHPFHAAFGHFKRAIGVSRAYEPTDNMLLLLSLERMDTN